MSFFKVFQICYSYIFFINITSKQKLRLIVQTVISWCFVCLQESVRSCIFQTVISWCFVYLQESVRSCICVLGVMYLCVRVHVFVCQRSCICVLEVMYLCVRGHVFVCWWSCICVLDVMYLCVGGHVFVCQTSCICVLGVSSLPLSTILIFDCGIVLAVCTFQFFDFIPVFISSKC